jgi:hypothetical protein
MIRTVAFIVQLISRDLDIYGSALMPMFLPHKADVYTQAPVPAATLEAHEASI